MENCEHFKICTYKIEEGCPKRTRDGSLHCPEKKYLDLGREYDLPIDLISERGPRIKV